mmetsp:Transcript_60852/g.128763  ORF Transcript_60852/g.128763 Transcript_60852/m.128763 type:complete len:254 (+) Transcript_60852:1040-1801(+)
MRTHRSDGEALLGVYSEKARNEVFHSVADRIREGVVGGQNLLVENPGVLILEWQVAAHKSEEDHSATPKIAHLWHILLPCHHFWRRIARRSTGGAQALAIPEEVAEAKVHNLDALVFVQQQILWLQVSMHHSHLVDFLHSRYDLVEEATCFGLRNPPSFDNVVEEFTTTCKLHYEVQLTTCLYDLEELHDVWVPDQFQDVHFSRNSLYIGYLDDTILLQDLDGNIRPRQYVPAQFDLAEGALTNCSSKNVVAN